MHAQAALRVTPLCVASNARGWMLRGVVRPRVSFAPVRRLGSSSFAGHRTINSKIFFRGTGLRAGSISAQRWNPPSMTVRRELSLSPVAVVAPSPAKTGMYNFSMTEFIFCTL